MSDREHEQLLATATDRFERRLAEECGSLRSEIAELRVGVVEGASELRLEQAQLRLEHAQLRLEMSEQFAAARSESEARHRELLKWAFVFWAGQAAAVAGIVTAFN